ncbi:MAG: hypothetical protein EHM61_09540 [Acidobacteria bacterium]|nr:MAG: hypothetical protein EHM61_09540 [Acidobacteriota bacterium]
MTISDVADYCAVKDCTVALGDPAVGFIEIDSGGYKYRPNYSRFLSLNELSALPSPTKVVEQASSFNVNLSRGTMVMSRTEFEEELRAFRQKVGA